jgi:hypothetical protein
MKSSFFLYVKCFYVGCAAFPGIWAQMFPKGRKFSGDAVTPSTQEIG